MNKIELFLDSGAYTAASQGHQIDIQDYISYIKEKHHLIKMYANLDVIGDAEATLVNQKIMEKAGLSPIPCYHYGEAKKFLRHYASNYTYFALGGVAGRMMTTEEMIGWLDPIFRDFICDKRGYPRIRVHGFGITSFKVMLRYPWYSVDSATWIRQSAYGGVMAPRWRSRKRIEQFVYDEQPFLVFVSAESPYRAEAGEHYERYSPKQQKIIASYVKEQGFEFGKNLFDKDGVFAGVIEPGISNAPYARARLNKLLYQELMNHQPEWPWKMKLTEHEGEDLLGSEEDLPVISDLRVEGIPGERMKIYLVTGTSPQFWHILRETNYKYALCSFAGIPRKEGWLENLVTE